MSLNEVLLIIAIIVSSPFVLFFCAKFTTLGIYQAKRFIEKQKEASKN